MCIQTDSRTHAASIAKVYRRAMLWLLYTEVSAAKQSRAGSEH